MDLSRVFVVANATKPHALRALADLKIWCQDRGIDAVAVEDAPPADADGAIALALGGDGTVLRAAALFQSTAIPILGVNVGSLGFLTQAPIGGLTHALEQVRSDAFTIEERMRLAYEAGDFAGTVLNDVVIAGDDDTGFCELELGGATGTSPPTPETG